MTAETFEPFAPAVGPAPETWISAAPPAAPAPQSPAGPQTGPQTGPEPPAAEHVCVHQDPWWRGVPGMDPQLPFHLTCREDIDHAAALVTAALATRFLHLEVRGSSWRNARPRSYTLVRRWRGWLAEAPTANDFHHRKTTLWQVCESQRKVSPGGWLSIARELHAVLPLPFSPPVPLGGRRA